MYHHVISRKSVDKIHDYETKRNRDKEKNILRSMNGVNYLEEVCQECYVYKRKIEGMVTHICDTIQPVK